MDQFWLEAMSGYDFENGSLKNKCIAKTKEPVLIFVNREVTNSKEIVDLLQNYPYMDQNDVLVLCKHAPAESELANVLMDPELEVYAMIIKRLVFSKVGPFNDRLQEDTNREFICRALNSCSVLFLECEEVNWKKTYSKQCFRTYAYLLVRHLQELQNASLLEQSLGVYVEFAAKKGCKEYFEQVLSQLLDENRETYEQIYRATAPILILGGGEEVCYGVLSYFAECLAKAFTQMGQNVILMDGKQNGNEGEQFTFSSRPYQAIIGFQATALLKEKFQMIRGPRFEFWFDHPMFFHTLLDQMKESVTFLCQDGDHADYIEKVCTPGRGLHFPPGINVYTPDDREKKYDLSFMGTYFDESETWKAIDQKEGIFGQIAREVAQYLLTHVEASFHEAAELFTTQYRELLEPYSYVEITNSLFEACRVVPYTYRNRVIRTILDAGYELHVYGDSWWKYPCRASDRLVIHDAVSPAEMAKTIADSRISLNVMTWHKDGMTERIMEIMMAKTVCLTDESRYLKKNFTQFDDIAMYRLDQLDELPGMIGKLLENKQLQQRIAENAYQRVKREHTWEVRAGQLLELIRQT